MNGRMRYFGKKVETIKRLKILAFIQKVKGLHNQRKEIFIQKNHGVRDETFFQTDSQVEDSSI